MRSLSGSSDPALSAPRPLALILAGVAAPVWGVAGLALGLALLLPAILVLALSAPWAWSWRRSSLRVGLGPIGPGAGFGGQLRSWPRGPGSAGAGSAGPGYAGGG
jgi:hypothetical protein